MSSISILLSSLSSSPPFYPRAMDLRSTYDVPRTVEFILGGGFSRVGLQFPDEMLKDSIRVEGLLRAELRSRGADDVAMFVMADTTFGSCCVDEVAASHVDADCVVHYGHACLSPTSNLPAFFVFGKAAINVDDCVKFLSGSLSATPKPALVLFGLEYAYAIEEVKSALVQQVLSLSNSEVHFAEVKASVIKPASSSEKKDAKSYLSANFDANEVLSHNAYDHSNSKSGKVRIYNLGGLIWKLPVDCEITGHLLFWIGSDNSAFANLALTFGDCEIVRYDPNENSIEKDISEKKRILKRRYYLVERAKDANIVGILVGTLGVAGYLNMIYQMKDLIVDAGKKAYLFVMGRPNPAKLANFPECDVFIYVSCAQTALLDSKEFLAPVITPFEAMLAFKRGSQWTGAYVMEFQDLISSSALQLGGNAEATRFSFFEGGYVEDFEIEDREEEHNRDLALAKATKEALTIAERCTSSGLVKGKAKSVTEFFASRTYHGLEVTNENSQTQSVLIGRTGRASGYDHETGGTEKT